MDKNFKPGDRVTLKEWQDPDDLEAYSPRQRATVLEYDSRKQILTVEIDPADRDYGNDPDGICEVTLDQLES